MSVRAYRVVEIKTKKTETFNLWHDRELMNYLQKEGAFLDSLNDDGFGLWEIPVEVLKNGLTELKDQDTAEAIKADIKEAEAKQEDYITYYCY